MHPIKRFQSLLFRPMTHHVSVQNDTIGFSVLVTVSEHRAYFNDDKAIIDQHEC